MASKTGYVNGSDVLLMIDGSCVGHCTTHTVTFNSDTKDRSVKPVLSKGIASGLWKSKSVTGLSISISAEGLVNYDETENGIKALLTAWETGESVEVKCFEREAEGGASSSYLEGSFVITSIEEAAPAQDDTTYSISLENDGEPSLFTPSNITDAA